MAEEEGGLGPWKPLREGWKGPGDRDFSPIAHEAPETPQARVARGENLLGAGPEGDEWSEQRKLLEIGHPATKNALLLAIRQLLPTTVTDENREMRIEALAAAYQKLGNTP